MHRQQISHGDLKAMNLLWYAEPACCSSISIAVVQHRSPAATCARLATGSRAPAAQLAAPIALLHRWLDEHLPPAA
jgi:hypothetical protein